jgi:hypothetical protein
MMEDKKALFIEKYNELKALNNGAKLLRKDFLKFSNIKDQELERVFGKNSYSKLQAESGDNPNKLQLVRTPIVGILENFGLLVRKHQRNIVIADWLEANYSPKPDGIRVVHKIKWSRLPNVFIDHFKNKTEWTDVLNILQGSLKPNNEPLKTNKVFTDIVEKIVQWTPDRKRAIEEGYKIEIRNYLEKHFSLEEEVGDTNPDLLINEKYPIEIKRDPSQSEYDRLLGQMIRHNKSFGNAIAIITNISSQDRFKKFQKLFTEVHDKLGMTAELFCK